MDIFTGIGFSNDADPELAAQQAAFIAKSNLKQNRIDLALVFSTIEYHPSKTLPVLNQILTGAKIVGCSGAGLILPKTIETRGIAVLTIASDRIVFGSSFIEKIRPQSSAQAGMQLAQSALQDFGHHGRGTFLMLMDSLLPNTTDILKGVQQILGNVFPIVGAGSCDDFSFKDSFQFTEKGYANQSAIGLMMGGTISVGSSARHGWKPLGKPRTIDEVEGNIIKKIDGKMASFLYDEFFEDEARNLRKERLGQMSILYPLGVYIEGSQEYLLKNAVDIRPDGSIVCQGTVPVGSEVHIMIGNKDFCKQAVTLAATEAQEKLLGKQPKFVLVIESMARLKLLGRLAYEELGRIREIFGSTVPVFGMYSNGEVCPFQTGDRFDKPHLLNESIVILAIG